MAKSRKGQPPKLCWSSVWVGFSFSDWHCAFYIKVLQFLISEISIHLYLRLLGDHLGNILPLYRSVVFEVGGCRSELRAARQKMATGAMRAVAIGQKKIIFKAALKINCAVLLTQSPNCCMVNFQRRHFAAVQLVFDEHWVFWWTPNCTSDVVREFKHPITFRAICTWHIFNYCPGADSFKSRDREEYRTDLTRKSSVRSIAFSLLFQKQHVTVFNFLCLHCALHCVFETFVLSCFFFFSWILTANLSGWWWKDTYPLWNS